MTVIRTGTLTRRAIIPRVKMNWVFRVRVMWTTNKNFYPKGSTKIYFCKDHLINLKYVLSSGTSYSRKNNECKYTREMEKNFLFQKISKFSIVKRRSYERWLTYIQRTKLKRRKLRFKRRILYIQLTLFFFF